jgi:hypothetical protein
MLLSPNMAVHRRKAPPFFALCIFSTLSCPKISVTACQSNLRGVKVTRQRGTGTSKSLKLLPRLFFKLEILLFSFGILFF